MTIEKKNIVLDDSQVDFLANCYLKLKKNKDYQKLSKTFQNYVSEFLDDELLAIQRAKGNKNGQ